jgi:peptide chain release factor 2
MQAARGIEEYGELVASVKQQLTTIHSLVEPDVTAEKISTLESEMNADGFWSDQDHAAKVSAEHTRAKRKLDGFRSLEQEVEDAATFLDMAKESDGADQVELLNDLEAVIVDLGGKLARLQEESLFTGEYDGGPCIVAIAAGEGGTDAQDWTEMLQRMYLRFCERRGFKVEFNHESQGEEAGLKSTSFTVRGDNAYGIMNAEAGVHRLVRLSPFSNGKRQTSFAQVEVYPLIEGDVEVDIDDKDLRVDTYRASGAGGQHVNKTDSAIRITHIPTGVVVQCQNERSQMQNRETAMKMLTGKLLELERQKREATVNAEKGDAQNIGFGSQIRSYVMQPYQMVKDLRTRYESGNVQNVLDGELDEFIRAYLLHRAHGGSSSREIVSG